MSKKRIGVIILFFALMFMSSFGGNIESLSQQGATYDDAGKIGLLHSIGTLLVSTVVFMAIPFIIYKSKKEKLPHKKGKQICLWNSIVVGIVFSVIAIAMNLGFVGGIGALLFYFINTWIFVENKLENKESNIEKSNSICPWCGYMDTLSLEFCPECGGYMKSNKKNDTFSNTNTSHVGVNEVVPAETIERTTIKKNEEIHTQQTVEVQSSNEKTRYCSRCGGIIDNTTKKCTRCNKQYFKLKKTSIAIILLCIVLLVLGAFNIVQLIEHQNLVNTLVDSDLVFVEYDGTKRYHEYDCHKFKGESFSVFDIKTAKSKKYDPCPYCQ